MCVPYASLHVTAVSNQAGRIQTLSFLFVVVIYTVGGLFFRLAFHLYAFYCCCYKFQIGHMLEGLDLCMWRPLNIHLNMDRIGKD